VTTDNEAIPPTVRIFQYKNFHNGIGAEAGRASVEGRRVGCRESQLDLRDGANLSLHVDGKGKQADM